MHSSPLILLALATAALTLPTDNATDTFSIEKRSSRPWLDNYYLNDVTCQDANRETLYASEERPFLEAGSCQSFTPALDRLGGSWGAGTFSINSWWAYENDDCTGTVKAKINRKDGEAGFCFSLDGYLGCKKGDDVNPCWFNSVRGNK